MTTHSRILYAILALLAATSCQQEAGKARGQKSLPHAEAAELLINRNWMDLWPASETEKLKVFRFVPDMGGGVFQDRTLFQGSFELFSFRVEGDEIHFNLHHNKQKASATFRIQRVDGPEPFDLKLTIDSSPRGPDVYFGRSAETATDLGFHPMQALVKTKH